MYGNESASVMLAGMAAMSASLVLFVQPPASGKSIYLLLFSGPVFHCPDLNLLP